MTENIIMLAQWYKIATLIEYCNFVSVWVVAIEKVTTIGVAHNAESVSIVKSQTCLNAQIFGVCVRCEC